MYVSGYLCVGCFQTRSLESAPVIVRVPCLGAGAPNPAESTHLLAASLQGSTLNFPCKIIFDSKGNINFIIIPSINFEKNIRFFRSHPIFCFTYLKEATFFCLHLFLMFLTCFCFWLCVLHFVISFC